MLQRAVPVRRPHVALGQPFEARAPLKPRTLARAVVDRSLRLLRSLGEFIAAGGSLS